MTAGSVRRRLPGAVGVRYEELMTHCLGCTWCRENPATSCTKATQLRRNWSAAWRVVR